MSSFLSIKNLTKEFTSISGYKNLLLDNISFDLPAGEITSVLAPTGSGKSTLLKIITGFDKPTSGEIIPELKNVLYLPADDLIFPWLNVKENILFNNTVSEKSEYRNIISFVKLDGYEDHYPSPLSKGFIFRIALARSLLRKPDLLVIDETFSLIRPGIRTQLMELTCNASAEFGINVFFATTNITSALFLSHKIYLMQKNPGRIIEEFQIDLPYKRTHDLIKTDDYKICKLKIEKRIDELPTLANHEFSI